MRYILAGKHIRFRMKRICSLIAESQAVTDDDLFHFEMQAGWGWNTAGLEVEMAQQPSPRLNFI
jgi:hypothetical protein